MNLFRALLNPSGGILYHIKGFLYSQNLWLNFNKNLEKLLFAWRKFESPSGGVILIGSSGGYCLSPEWLVQYKEVVIVDPDPVAHKIFKEKYKPTDTNIISSDVKEVFVENGRPCDRSLQAVLSAYPEHDIVFCNIIGQLKFLYPDIRESLWVSFFRDLVESLKPRGFFSFHDRYSSSMRPDVEGYFKNYSTNRLTPEDFVRELYQTSASAITGSIIPRTAEVIDHCTAHFFSEYQAYFLSWQIVPKFYHCVEVVYEPGNKEA